METMIDFGLLVAVVIAVSQLLKQGKLLKAKFIPVVNLALGVLAGVVYLDGSIKDNVLFGIIIGLSASGLFDLSKAKTKK